MTTSGFLESKMNIGIVGLGVVGSALKFGFEKLGHEVVGFDIKFGDVKFEDVLSTEIVFICVPTPSTEEGCDTSVVEGVVKDFCDAKYEGVIVIKSTVLPGTTKKLSEKYDIELVFCPEFLRERCAISDFCENHDILVVGTDNNIYFEKIVSAHGFFPRKVVRFYSTTGAELVKYFHNTFNMLRIVFANEFYDLCKHFGVDYMKIKNTVCNHRLSTNKYYLDCSEKWRGAGGPCLPKDTYAIAKLFSEIYDSENIFEFLVKRNKKFSITVPEGMRK